MLILRIAVAACCLAARGAPELLAQGRASVDTFRVVKSYPHDPAAYTQGLIFRDGFLSVSCILIRFVKSDASRSPMAVFRFGT